MFSLFASEKPQPKAAEVAIQRITSISTNSLSRFERLPKAQRYLIIGAASLGGLSLLWSISASSRFYQRPPIPSPKQTLLPELTSEEAGELPYHPAALPGARDVDSPYGSIRVYEFGPRDGERVLLIHGISTPSIALADLAHKLAGKGRRVMLFDLFGRGYSSAPSPADYNYNASLYTTQILLCLQSSPILWTPFTIIGYSLGGAIAADFTSYFPSMVRGLVLVAPGGLIRPHHFGIGSKMLYRSSWMPEWMVSKLVASKLWTGAKRVEPAPDAVENAETTTTTTTVSEGGAKFSSSNQMLLPGNPHSTVSAVVDWQIKHHYGFVPAFISTIRYAPIYNQHHRWSVIKENIETKTGPLRDVWLVLGETDPIIIADEVTEDAKAVLGEDNVRVRVIEGAGHEIAIEKADDIVKVVRSILGKGESSKESGSSKSSSRRKHGGSHASSSAR
ncbi:alpha/beta-hydrolase [Clathrospora elynae]|uniref:Alpha/beta-hydrolase n=1 Tax=Clathrospora elynae TaxID=706981 RepID=A0A6A5SIB1_9PLEO|nr:alpha/beta-hydrolase [Clathrospora elynae]